MDLSAAQRGRSQIAFSRPAALPGITVGERRAPVHLRDGPLRHRAPLQWPLRVVASRRALVEVGLAGALLARGVPQAEVAARVGLYDQSQLHRHFKRIAGVTPGAYARAAR